MKRYINVRTVYARPMSNHAWCEEYHGIPAKEDKAGYFIRNTTAGTLGWIHKDRFEAQYKDITGIVNQLSYDKKNLDIRIRRIESTIENHYHDPADYTYLKEQLAAMKEYSRVLSIRIELEQSKIMENL